MMIRCETNLCVGRAITSFQWPGAPERHHACAKCVERACYVAGTMGFKLDTKPVNPDAYELMEGAYRLGGFASLMLTAQKVGVHERHAQAVAMAVDAEIKTRAAVPEDGKKEEKTVGLVLEAE